jgi:hypothetical protein
MSGLTGQQTELLYTLDAPVTKNTYTTGIFSAPAATVNVMKIPGGFFSSAEPNPLGRSLYGKGLGTIANAATGYTFSPAISLNTTAGTYLSTWAVVCYAATAPTASITCQFDFEFWITCQQSGDLAGLTLQINGNWSQSTVAAGGVLNTAAQTGKFAANWTGLTPATTYFIELYGTWGTSSASATTTLQQFFLFGLN